MAPRAPGVHTHEEWKGMAQPVGLVVEPVVLNRLGVFPESATTVLADWQQRLEQLLEDQPVGEQWLSVAPSLEMFCQEVLAWQPGDLCKPEELAAPVAVHLDDYDEVLRPNWIVPEPSQGDGPLKAQLLVQELHLGTPFDALPKGADGRRSWEATPQQRLERLLKESEHPIGLLWNGVALRLVYAPRGESSGHLTFPLEPMTTVDGRPMLAAVQMLLGPDRLFEGGASNTRLRPLMEQSRKEQNEVSTRLAEQVLEALWILLRGFDAAGLEIDDPSHIYGGLITVLLRLVFLLYAEDEELMPTDSLYGQHYSVGGLAQRLRQDRTDYQNAMEGRRGAWATLLSLFRLVYDGGGSTEAYLPARHGDLFDPETYPFLEGRTADTSYTDGPLTSVPAISDDVVELVLTKLLLLDGQILSYRALDVEQIGSVYEGIMGFMVEKATGPSVGITHRPPRQKITITVVVDANELIVQAPAKRANWLDERAGVKLKLAAPIVKALKEASSNEDLAAALGKRLSAHTPRVLPAGSLILQPTEERRRSGSHYTPRALTEPIVAEALRPWLERCNGKPTSEQVLALKLCDPAMGSGAFLVALCRYLARWLVAAWEDPQGPGFPPEFRNEWDKDLYARRLIAQRCLYGVDKNPFAVNLAKLSLWLVTLSKELPFTFVDHALKCGDSLVGYSVQEIQTAMKEVQLGFLNEQNEVFAQMGLARRECFADDSLTDEGYDRKKELLQQQIQASDGLRQAGDLMAAAFFDAPKPKDRDDKRQVYLALLSGAFQDEALHESVQGIRDRLAEGEKGIKPFHWQLEFPEVFQKERCGFDVFVGNPPFLGGSRISELMGMGYFSWLVEEYPPARKHCDLCGYFFSAAFRLLTKDGSAGLIACNTIYQGDTRDGVLEPMLVSGGSIYSAIKRKPWPGAAAVIVSVIHFTKSKQKISSRLNGSSTERISAFLIPGSVDQRPFKLETALWNSVGCQIYGLGFLFADDGKNETGSIAELNDLSQRSPKQASYIKPYLGGEDVNQTPTLSSTRFCINVSSIQAEQELMLMPDLYNIIKERVKPERMRLGSNPNNIPLRKKWWAFQAHRPDLYECIKKKKLEKVLVISRVTTYLQFALVPSGQIFSHKLLVIPTEDYYEFGVLQSLVHEEWARLFTSTLKDDLNYSASDCLSNFPLPLCQPNAQNTVAIACKEFDDTRLSLVHRSCLTSAMHVLNSPKYCSDDASRIRALVGLLNDAVLDAYGWSDLGRSYGFGLDYLHTDDDQISDEMQALVDSGELFFWEASEALNFQSQLEACGAISSRSKLPWRYRWPDEVRDAVLARLLALNAERYAEEEGMGLHSKGGKQAASAVAKRARKGKASAASSESHFELTSEPYQTGLQLF